MPNPTILCATDLGPSGKQALSLAAAFAAATGAPLHVTHVCDAPMGEWPQTDPAIQAAIDVLHRRLRERVERASESLASDVEALGRKIESMTTSVDEGRPWEAAVALAKRESVGLLVVGPHRLSEEAGIAGKIKDRILGSTADRIARHAPCPVLISCGLVPSTVAGKRWMVGVDFSEESAIALREAHRLAYATQGELILVHVLPQPFHEGDLPDDWREVVGSLAGLAEEKLRELAVETGVDVPCAFHVVPGRATHDLSSTAAELGVDFVVVGTRGHRGLVRAVLGSSAEMLLRRSPVPVLITRAESGPGLSAGSGAKGQRS